jgi:hypothetical protein
MLFMVLFVFIFTVFSFYVQYMHLFVCVCVCLRNVRISVLMGDYATMSTYPHLTNQVRTKFLQRGFT